MDKKILMYGGIAVGVIFLISMLTSRNSGGNATAAKALDISGTMSQAVAANNQAAYDYLAASAIADAQSRQGIFQAGEVALSDTLREISNGIAAQAVSNRDVSSIGASTASAVHIERAMADTATLMSNNDYLLGMKELENDAKMIGLQLPVAQINADTTIRAIQMQTNADQNIAQINATRDVSIQQSAANADQAIASYYMNAAIQQAYYQYKSTKAMAKAAQGPGGLMGFGNLVLGKASGFSLSLPGGIGVSGSEGASSNKGGA